MREGGREGYAQEWWVGMEGRRKLKRRTERTMSYRNIGRNNMRTGGKLAAQVRRLSELCVCVPECVCVCVCNKITYNLSQGVC